MELHVSCLCGAIKQTVSSQATGKVEYRMCHCNTCRHSTGLLCTSYCQVSEPDVSSGFGRFDSSGQTARYFCSSCSSHVFRSMRAKEQTVWEVATGTITASSEDASLDDVSVAHLHVEDTEDGGGAPWLAGPCSPRIDAVSQLSEELEASCACGRVNFRIGRPTAESYIPHRGYTDLIHPYFSTAESITSNPKDEKWWIQGQGAKYLAGTCACRPCRLGSGFEIQTWAFVPVANIIFHVDGKPIPLDFATLPPGILRSFASSDGVVRESCGGCGATVFWREKVRPDVIDVSVGLLRAAEGARAETWLHWWAGRVSFDEEAETGRSGSYKKGARALINKLAQGLRQWGG